MFHRKLVFLPSVEGSSANLSGTFLYEPIFRKAGSYAFVTDASQLRQEEVDCFVGSRDLVVVQVPPEGYPVPTLKDGTSITSQGFFRSTGTSNETKGKTFPGVYYPFAGRYDVNIPDKGWFIKMGRFFTTADDWKNIPKWFDSLCSLLGTGYWKTKVTKTGTQIIIQDTEGEEKCLGYANFLGYFPEWWQVRLSAALGGEFWDRKDMEPLKYAALNYTWDREKERFEESPIEFTMVAKSRCDTRKTDENTIEAVNNWLENHHAFYAGDPLEWYNMFLFFARNYYKTQEEREESLKQLAAER